MTPGIVRPIAICLFLRNGRFLAAEGFDAQKQQTYYRPLGGTIEFGELSHDTIIRELREELGADVAHLRYWGTLENIFIYDGATGHEIVMVYDGEFVNATLYDQPVLDAVEDSGVAFKAYWLDIAEMSQPDAPPVYPTGLMGMIKSRGVVRDRALKEH